MASEDVATRAPENDAAEDQSRETTSLFPNDTPAQSGPTMGEHCTTDRPLAPSAKQPSGEITTLNGVECYVSKPADYPHAPSRLLLLLTGGTGLHSTNNQLQADAYAAKGYLTVMPDQFAGDPAPKTTTAATSSDSSNQEISIIERVKMGIAETAKSFRIDLWLARHTAEKVLPILHKALEGAKEAYADAVANGAGVYGVGYCFGAKYILLLLGRHPDDVAKGQAVTESLGEAGNSEVETKLKAGAIAHGTLVTREDLAAVRAPVMMICIPNDPLFPDEVRKAGMTSLTKNLATMENSYRELVYEGVPHGFAVVGEYEDEHIRSSQKKAFEEMCEFLDSH